MVSIIIIIAASEWWYTFWLASFPKKHFLNGCKPTIFNRRQKNPVAIRKGNVVHTNRPPGLFSMIFFALWSSWLRKLYFPLKQKVWRRSSQKRVNLFHSCNKTWEFIIPQCDKLWCPWDTYYFPSFKLMGELKKATKCTVTDTQHGHNKVSVSQTHHHWKNADAIQSFRFHWATVLVSHKESKRMPKSTVCQSNGIIYANALSHLYLVSWWNEPKNRIS